MNEDEWSTSALARETGLHKSVVHRLLVTLAAAGLLVQDRGTGLFALSPLIAALGRRAERSGALSKLARPILQSLAEESEETVSLCILRGDSGLCLDVLESPHSMRFTIAPGEAFPVHAGCVGKVILAYQTGAFVDGLLGRGRLARYTDNTITEPRELRRELSRIRRQGYGFSDSEITPGARSVGAPVFEADGTVSASLVVSAPSVRMTDDDLPRFVAMVRDAAAALSAMLGHSGPPGGREAELRHAV